MGLEDKLAVQDGAGLASIAKVNVDPIILLILNLIGFESEFY